MKFKNPIIPGFAPDPSIVLVKDTFFLVNSSFHIFPGLPIYTSKNLQDWNLIGHAISRPAQLDLSHAFTKFIPLPDGVPLVITGGLFAPTIRYYNGTFYIVCTNVYDTEDGKDSIFQNFLMSCPESKILEQHGWSDPMPFGFPGIDPSLFFDTATGKAYVQGSYRIGPPWAPDCSIRQFEMDVSTGKALSDIKFLWKGASVRNDAEGPHVYEKDGWYYLLTAEASTFEPHEINIARARSIWGPYESCPANPLLTAYQKKEEVQWTGHGDLLEDGKGNWWCVHLGIRGDSQYKRHPLGRETYLTPVKWPRNQWPTISQTKPEFEIDAEAKIDMDGSSNSHTVVSRELEDCYIRIPRLADYSYSKESDRHALHPQGSTLSSPLGTMTFVGPRQRSLACTASTSLVLETNCQKQGTCAGLAVYKDHLRYASISYDATSSSIMLEVAHIDNRRLRTSQTKSDPLPAEAEAVEFQIKAEPEKYVFQWLESSSKRDWKYLGEVDTAVLSGHDMTGTLFGIFATTSGTEDADGRDFVIFDCFNVE